MNLRSLSINEVIKPLVVCLLSISVLSPVLYSGDSHAVNEIKRTSSQNNEIKTPSPKIGAKIKQAYELYNQEKT